MAPATGDENTPPRESWSIRVEERGFPSPLPIERRSARRSCQGPMCRTISAALHCRRDEGKRLHGEQKARYEAVLTDVRARSRVRGERSSPPPGKAPDGPRFPPWALVLCGGARRAGPVETRDPVTELNGQSTRIPRLCSRLSPHRIALRAMEPPHRWDGSRVPSVLSPLPLHLRRRPSRLEPRSPRCGRPTRRASPG